MNNKEQQQQIKTTTHHVPRAPCTNAHHVGHDDHACTCHAWFGRKPHGKTKLTTEIIHPTREHHRQHTLHGFRWKDSFVGGGATATVRQCRGHDGHRFGGLHLTATHEIKLQFLLQHRLVGKGMRFVHHVGQTSIAVGRAGFALVHVLVDFTFVLVPNQSFPVPQHGVDFVFNAGAFFNQTATHDGARIDQWVVGHCHTCTVWLVADGNEG